jgi:Kef-type K+ transport system membrane component KefB
MDRLRPDRSRRFIGKSGGSSIAARISGLSWRQSAALGILMNTRSLMELMVLNVALDLGAITLTLAIRHARPHGHRDHRRLIAYE